MKIGEDSEQLFRMSDIIQWGNCAIIVFIRSDLHAKPLSEPINFLRTLLRLFIF